MAVMQLEVRTVVSSYTSELELARLCHHKRQN